LRPGTKVISTRRRLRDLIAYFGGKVVHPVWVCPAASQGPQSADLPKFKELAKDAVEFAEWTLTVLKQIVLAIPDYVKMITSNAFTTDLLHGMVTEHNKVNFYDGKLRVVDCNGKEVCSLHRSSYRDFVPSTSSVELHEVHLLKQRGWKDSSKAPIQHLLCRPLGAPQRSDACHAQARAPTRNSTGPSAANRPHTLANHLARVIEMIYPPSACNNC